MADKKNNNLKENKKLKKEQDKLVKEIIPEVIEEVKEQVEKKAVNDITKDVVKKIKKDSLETLKEEVVEDVKQDVRESIQKEEKKLLRQRNFKIIRRDIVILILIGIIISLCYLIYKEVDIGVKEIKEETKVEDVVQEEIKDLNWYKEKYSYLLELTHLDLSSDNVNKFYLYNDNYSAENINDSIKLTMAYNLIDNKKIEEKDNKLVISNSDMKAAYKKIFDTEYKQSTFNIGCMTYSFNKNNYEAYKSDCNNINNFEIVEEINNIYEENDCLFITTVMGVINNNNLYNYKDLYNPIARNFNNNINDYKGNLNSFKYKFKKSKDNYKFVSIEKQ